MCEGTCFAGPCYPGASKYCFQCKTEEGLTEPCDHRNGGFIGGERPAPWGCDHEFATDSNTHQNVEMGKCRQQPENVAAAAAAGGDTAAATASSFVEEASRVALGLGGVLMGGLTSYRHPHRDFLKHALATVSELLSGRVVAPGEGGRWSSGAPLKWHITRGTLLAQQRTGGAYFIPWDSDMDVATTASDSELASLQEGSRSALAKAGLALEKQDDVWRVVPLVGTAPLSYKDEEASGRYMDLYQYHNCAQAHPGRVCISVTKDAFASEQILPMRECEMVGVVVNCPADPAAMLKQMYGKDWDQMDHRWVGTVDEDGEGGQGKWVKGRY